MPEDRRADLSPAVASAGARFVTGTERTADVSICIPAWNSEAFIDRTIRCAREQTHQRTAILISVDRCGDATAQLCAAHAHEDSRIEVFVQPERLGWAGNVNFLLERVRTEFFFLYFHDDLLLPTYTERLLSALRERPDAASAHCDMGHFGASEHVSVGRNYDGPVAKRLAELLVVPERGSPLRSMTRTQGHGTRLRMPTGAVAGLWANEPYLMSLIAAGPALHVPETLYLRWDQRRGGLTDGWKGLSLDQIVSGFGANVSAALEIADNAGITGSERDVLTFCLYVSIMPRVRAAAIEHGRPLDARDAEVHPEFREMAVPAALPEFGADIERWALVRHAQLADLAPSVAAR